VGKVQIKQGSIWSNHCDTELKFAL